MTSHPAQANSQLPADKRIAFVLAGWHRDIVEQSLVGFKNTIDENSRSVDLIDVIDVPGSLEIPLQCQSLARSGDYTIIIAAGLIVDGGIYRHNFVSSTVLDAMMKVQLETEVPILSVVLTPHHFSEHNEAHHDFFYKHFKMKGEEAADACLQMLSLTK